MLSCHCGKRREDALIPAMAFFLLNMKINLSLNQKLISITVIAFIIIVGIITANNYLSTRRDILLAQQEKVVNLSDGIKYGLMSLMLEGKFDEVQRVIEDVSVGKRIEELKIFSPDSGVILVSANKKEIGQKVKREDYQRAQTQVNSAPFTVSREGTLYIARILPIENAAICHSCHSKKIPILGVIDLRFSMVEPLQNIRNLALNHLLLACLSILLFSLVFWLIVIKLIDEPLGAVMDAIQDVEAGNYDKQVAIKRLDIIGKLSEKFNTMIGKINEARKEVEKYHREQMKRASQMALTGEIASGIAHEIKNPLACISSALQVVDCELDKKSETKQIITEVLHRVKKLDNTVKRILEFAKPAKPVKEIGNINNVLTDTLFFITQIANAKNIEVRSSLDPDLKEIYGDGKLLRQLFLNISLNGIEAMGEGGVLGISTKNVRRDGKNGGKDFAEVKIADSGSGIAPENLQNIFDPFFTTKEKGTGLGLSISMQIIQEHDGILEVDTLPGKGTTFRVYFPISEEPNHDN